MLEVTFLNEVCVVAFQEYQKGGGTCIQLYVKDSGAPMATATVNLHGLVKLPSRKTCLDNGYPEHLAIKASDENEGLLEALQQAGIVGQHVCYANNGFGRYPVVPLLVDPTKHRETSDQAHA